MSDIFCQQGYKNFWLRVWLLLLVFMVLAIIVVGGATRLTGSGLSITKWGLISGILPPLTIAQWQDAFTEYQKIPQYHLVNSHITLAEFKAIFWWEWGHRLLGRLIGVCFLVGWGILLIKRSVSRRFGVLLLWIGSLILLQGIIGWLMVKSGFADDMISVSHYRLALHLLLANIILALIVTAFLHSSDLLLNKLYPNYFFLFLWFLFAGQLILGALVAGQKAGLVYNSWPLMAGQWIPSELWEIPLSSWFEAHMSLQFLHRIYGYVLFLTVCIGSIYQYWRNNISGRQLLFLQVLLWIQMITGIITLISVAPLEHYWLALWHQLGASLLGVNLIYIACKICSNKVEPSIKNIMG